MADTKEFPERLARLRAERRLTQKELSDASGISLVQIARYETGRSKPRLSALMKLAEALDISVEDMTGEDDVGDGREITMSLTLEQVEKIEEFAKSQRLSFDQAVQRIVMQGLKMKLDNDSSMLARLEEDVPGAYEKLRKLLASD